MRATVRGTTTRAAIDLENALEPTDETATDLPPNATRSGMATVSPEPR